MQDDTIICPSCGADNVSQGLQGLEICRSCGAPLFPEIYVATYGREWTPNAPSDTGDEPRAPTPQAEPQRRKRKRKRPDNEGRRLLGCFGTIFFIIAFLALPAGVLFVLTDASRKESAVRMLEDAIEFGEDELGLDLPALR